MVELPFAADCCPLVGKLRTVLPLAVGIRDGAVQLVSTLRVCLHRRCKLNARFVFLRGQVTWRKQKGRLRLDQARLKTQHPQLVEQYMVEGFPLRYFRMDLNEHATSEPPPIEN